MLLYGFAMLYYSIKDRPYAGDENNVIARARIAYWQQRRYELLDPATPITIKSAPAQPDGQLDMFESEAA